MKCEICGKDILKDSQCIDYKYYHNDCIENLQQENQKYKEIINKAIELTKNLLKTEDRGYYQILFKEILKSLGDKE